MKLITESSWDTKASIIKEENGLKQYYIEGITLQGDIVNRNNRFYSTTILEREIYKWKAEKMDNHGGFGELNHPDSPTVNPKEVSHKFLDIHKEGNDFITKSVVMNTPNGQIVQAFIDVKGRLGISSRALGSLKEVRGVSHVQDDFVLITPGDIVLDPSAPKAFIKGIKEGVEYSFLNGIIVESVIHTIDQNYKSTMNTEQKDQIYLKAFQNLLKAVNESKK